ncbi:hypothetical protein [Escherichia phage phiWec190]|uniref:glycoside hydrolase family protein n=1 Tax=Escherichia coli TaxID=562 RepID=UPI001FF35273|nr:glycoside hydrolase family protein [Escherichia coli]BDU12074.1 hypothetical protein [Escherichia phage phiWec179]BDU12297.1 hypothetical protein [Escherichia phage phiWec181]BDU12737.1 hypothetical protein [Escherichia phage phiWec186]BDU13246.1 hypothetical protein [Escherichia phage phiWec188]BDU13657.1 hypothetical protein [Escherichia phage phiWec190]
MAKKVVDEFDMLAVDEGLKLTVYPDTLGYWTVGIGHLLTKKKDKAEAIRILDALVGRKTNGVITEKEARAIFADDVEKAKKQIKNSSILAPIYDKVSETRKLAIINMVFQLGLTGTEGFKNSLTLISNSYYTQAGKNMRASKWYSQTPNRAERVIKVLTSGTLDSYN